MAWMRSAGAALAEQRDVHAPTRLQEAAASTGAEAGDTSDTQPERSAGVVIPPNEPLSRRKELLDRRGTGGRWDGRVSGSRDVMQAASNRAGSPA